MASMSRVAIVGTLLLALHAPAAYAQSENGVTVDPRSPAGKEYALPIDRARRDADDSTDSGRASTPAFGAGVRADRAPGRTEDRSTRGGAARGTPPASPSSSSTSAQTATSAQQAREREGINRALLKASAGDGGSSQGSLALLLGGVAVMVIGVGAGFLLRRGKA